VNAAKSSTASERQLALEAARRRRRWDNLGRAGLLGAVVMMLPLLRQSFTADQFLMPKEVMAACLLWPALVWWGIGALWGRRVRLAVSPVTWAAIAFWGVHVWGFLVAAIREGSSPGLAWDRLQLVTLGLALFLMLQDFARGRRRFLIALAWLQVLSAAITAAWVLQEDFMRPVNLMRRLPDWRGYLSAGLGNTGHIADWIALSFAPAILLLVRERRRWAIALLAFHLGLAAMALVVCWSVHSNAGLIVALLWLCQSWLRSPRGRRLLWRRRGRIALVGALWAAAVLFYILPIPLHPHQPGILHEAFGSQRWKEGGSSRVLIWSGSLSMILDRPLLGWGTGNFTYGYPQAPNRFVGPNDAHAGAAGAWTNAAHNEIMQTWAELGLPGLLALIALVGAWFTSVHGALGRGNPINDDIRRATFAMALMGCVNAQMSFPLQLPSFLLFYAALAAVPLCLVDRNRSRRDEVMELEWPVPKFGRFFVKGNGMKSLRSIGMELRGWHPAIRNLAILLLALLAAWRMGNGAERFAASVHYRQVYEIAQLRGGQPAPLAVDAARRALELDAALVDASSDLAKVHYLQGDWQGVLAAVDSSLPRLQAPKLYYWRAEAHYRLGQVEAAEDDLFVVLTRTRPYLRGTELTAEIVAWIRTFGASPPGKLLEGF